MAGRQRGTGKVSNQPQPHSTGICLNRLLKSYGVEVIFSIPGVHTVELTGGLTAAGAVFRL